MTDLRDMLNVPMDEIKKPPVWPIGTYHGFIEKYEPGESREKKTKYLRFNIKCQRPDESVDITGEQYKDIDWSKRTFRKDFYLMDDKSQHWRLKDFLVKLGMDTEGATLAAVIPQTVGKPVKFQLTQRANQDNTELLNEIAEGGIELDS